MENNRESFKGRKVVVGVCSSIAVYKAAELVSALVKLGADTTVIMTASAKKLISPRIFQTLSRNKTYSDMWEDVAEWRPEHISIAESADIIIVAPATANTIGNFACGLAPDLLSSTYLAAKCPVLIAPAMNSNMYENPAVVRNMRALKSDGVHFVEPEVGMLACGVSGRGRLAEIGSILDAAARAYTSYRKKRVKFV